MMDFVDRRKLLITFFSAAKLILWVDVRGEETFVGRQDDSIVDVVIIPGGHGLGAGGRDALQEEVAELGEGGGFLAGNAALREEAKHLAERAAHTGGGGEIAAGGIEFGKIEGAADDGAPSGAGSAKQLLFAFGVVVAERRMNVGAGHGALASVGEHELAAVGQWIGFRRQAESVVVTVGVRLGRVAAWRNMVGVCRESGRRLQEMANSEI